MSLYFPHLIPIYFMKGALMTAESQKSPRYNGIPKQVSRKDFNEYILPHLSKRIKGPKPKLSFYKRHYNDLIVSLVGLW